MKFVLQLSVCQCSLHGNPLSCSEVGEKSCPSTRHRIAPGHTDGCRRLGWMPGRGPTTEIRLCSVLITEYSPAASFAIKGQPAQTVSMFTITEALRAVSVKQFPVHHTVGYVNSIFKSVTISREL